VLAIEDSPTGVASAHAAGLMTLMIPDLIQPDDETRSRVVHVGASLEDVLPLLDGRAEERLSPPAALAT
jgi:beta-phosphoglucomutase-like phosphatase (HAD superfamily)